MCLVNHPECHQDAALSLPRRVIDVSLSTSNFLQICETDEVGPYIALSHCWGSDIDLEARTLTSNIEARYVGFEMNLLPKTFRDAINLTRKLGIRYIWIDTICILQDNRYVKKTGYDSHEIELIHVGAIGNLSLREWQHITAMRTSRLLLCAHLATSMVF
jgi:hypothetical protein